MKKFIKAILYITASVAILASLTITASFVFLRKYKNIKIDTSLLELSNTNHETHLYRYDFIDRHSRKGSEVLLSESIHSGVKYKFIPYGEIPKQLINAFIAIEDKRFYKHQGVDFLRSAKAVVNYAIGGSSRFGGSTITQQLIKNLTGENEITSERKIKEVFSALNLEKEYDKSEIIEAYLNIINLSDGCRGIGAASEHFFNKEPDELTLSEMATLAAITNNPAKYNPRTNPQNAMSRRNLVLVQMHSLGYINDYEYFDAINEPINIEAINNDTNNINSWYIDMVIDDVISDLSIKYNISREYASFLLYSGGYNIYTALDISIQNILDKYYADINNFPHDESGEYPQSSMIVIDPYTGDILGVAGAIGEKKANRIQNYATHAKRPPGSAIKPLTVYAPAIDSGLINWSSIIEDSPLNTINKTWPVNANGKYLGNITVKHAIENSTNTVAVKVLDMLGLDTSFDFARNKLKIKSFDEKKDIGQAALALGQPSKGITLRELSAAYSIFFNGSMNKPRSYFKVTDMDGRIILDNTANQERVISKETAAIMTKLLECVVDSGTAKGLITLDDKISVAGKTGTTQNNCDRLFVGFTPDLICASWFGYEYPSNLDFFGGNFAAIFWDDVMTKIYSETQYKNGKANFDVPHTVQKMSFNSKTGELIDGNCNEYEVEEGFFSITQKNIP